jgi:hypothetical protein
MLRDHLVELRVLLLVWWLYSHNHVILLGTCELVLPFHY